MLEVAHFAGGATRIEQQSAAGNGQNPLDKTPQGKKNPDKTRRVKTPEIGQNPRKFITYFKFNTGKIEYNTRGLIL